MREFKFRAWNKITKKFYKLADIQVLGMELPSAFILEQYVGVKDVDGKYIYEGDILQVSSAGADTFNSEIKYITDDFYPGFDIDYPDDWDHETNALRRDNLSDNQEVMVIGNIHENPELLEDSNGSN